MEHKHRPTMKFLDKCEISCVYIKFILEIGILEILRNLNIFLVCLDVLLKSWKYYNKLSESI